MRDTVQRAWNTAASLQALPTFQKERCHVAGGGCLCNRKSKLIFMKVGSLVWIYQKRKTLVGEIFLRPKWKLSGNPVKTLCCEASWAFQTKGVSSPDKRFLVPVWKLSPCRGSATPEVWQGQGLAAQAQPAAPSLLHPSEKELWQRTFAETFQQHPVLNYYFCHMARYEAGEDVRRAPLPAFLASVPLDNKGKQCHGRRAGWLFSNVLGHPVDQHWSGKNRAHPSHLSQW